MFCGDFAVCNLAHELGPSIKQNHVVKNEHVKTFVLSFKVVPGYESVEAQTSRANNKAVIVRPLFVRVLIQEINSK